MPCQQIHETVIRDILDVMDSVKDTTEIDLFNNNSYKSVASASSNLTLVFPVIASRGMSIQNASMVCKAIERKAVVMLQLLFSAANLSITDDESFVDVLSKYHTNLNLSNDMSVDQFLDYVDDIVNYNEAAGIPMNDRELYQIVKEDMKNLSYFLPNSVSAHSINDYRVYSESVFGDNNIVLEAKGNKPANNNGGNKPANSTPATGNNKPAKDDKKDNKTSSTNTNTYSSDRFNTSFKSRKDQADINKANADFYKNQILDNDIKKANELIPTTMLVQFVSKDKYGVAITNTAIIGVKAKLYPVDSTDLVTRIKLKNIDNNGLLKFIKATTREISFWRDLVFAIDKAKVDALSNSRRGSSSKMWKVLERRAVKSKLRRTLRMYNDASAISTLVVSQEEVEYLKKFENIDIEKPQIIRPIMEAYNLMGVCIVDEAMEVAKFIFDTGDDIYEVLSFNHLERESADNGYKKVINLMTKLAR